LELLKEAGFEGQDATDSEAIYKQTDRTFMDKGIAELEIAYDKEQNPAEKAEIREQIENTQKIMSKATNKFGKSRNMSDKYRLKVSRLIKVVLGEIAPDSPQLYKHFKAFLSFGTDNTYKPDKKIVWDIK